MKRAATYYRDGEAVGFDLIAKEVTPELAYLVEIERFSAKIGGREDRTPVSLRVTSISDARKVPGGSFIVTPIRSLRLARRSQ